MVQNTFAGDDSLSSKLNEVLEEIKDKAKDGSVICRALAGRTNVVTATTSTAAPIQQASTRTVAAPVFANDEVHNLEKLVTMSQTAIPDFEGNHTNLVLTNTLEVNNVKHVIIIMFLLSHVWPCPQNMRMSTCCEEVGHMCCAQPSQH